MPLPRLLFLLLLLLPIIEIYLLVKVGGVIGALSTVALVLFTAALGALLMRLQGLAVMSRVQRMAQQGEPPTAPMLEGLVILLSGAMLLLPGFFTDVLGLLGLLPPLRHALVAVLLRRVFPGPRPPRGPGAAGRGPATLEGEYTREDD